MDLIENLLSTLDINDTSYEAKENIEQLVRYMEKIQKILQTANISDPVPKAKILKVIKEQANTDQYNGYCRRHKVIQVLIKHGAFVAIEKCTLTILNYMCLVLDDCKETCYLSIKNLTVNVTICIDNLAPYLDNDKVARYISDFLIAVYEKTVTVSGTNLKEHGYKKSIYMLFAEKLFKYSELNSMYLWMENKIFKLFDEVKTISQVSCHPIIEDLQTVFLLLQMLLQVILSKKGQKDFSLSVFQKNLPQLKDSLIIVQPKMPHYNGYLFKQFFLMIDYIIKPI